MIDSLDIDCIVSEHDDLRPVEQVQGGSSCISHFGRNIAFFFDSHDMAWNRSNRIFAAEDDDGDQDGGKGGLFLSQKSN